MRLWVSLFFLASAATTVAQEDQFNPLLDLELTGGLGVHLEESVNTRLGALIAADFSGRLYIPAWNQTPFLRDLSFHLNLFGGYSPYQGDILLPEDGQMLETGALLGATWMPRLGSDVLRARIGLGGGIHLMHLAVTRLGESELVLGALGKLQLGLSVRIARNFTLELVGAIRAIGSGGSWRADMQAQAGVSVKFERLTPQLTIEEVELAEVFPAIYKTYVNQPVGSIVLDNSSGLEVSEVEVEFFIDRFMDSKTLSQTVPTLRHGDRTEIPLTAVFTARILDVAESETVDASLTLRYRYRNQVVTRSLSAPIRVLHRGAMSWADSYLLGAFITPRDPVIFQLARQWVNLAEPNRPDQLPRKLYSSMVLFEALGELGLSYVNDPNAPVIGSHGELDQVAVGRDLLKLRSGDCDDLTVLTLTLFESLGIETAYVTVPGHIFVLFNTGVPESGFASVSAERDRIVLLDGDVWVPLEVTLVGKSFHEAWTSAANTYRTYHARGDAEIWRTAEAHSRFEPVSLPDVSLELRLDDPSRFLDRVEVASSEVIEANYHLAVEDLIFKLSADPGNAALLTRLGALHAVNGEIDKARAAFREALENQADFPSAQSNLAMLEYRLGNYDEARGLFESTLDTRPDHPPALVGLAMVAHQQGDVATAQGAYDRAIATAPNMANRFSFMASTASGAAVASEGELATYFEYPEESP